MVDSIIAPDPRRSIFHLENPTLPSAQSLRPAIGIVPGNAVRPRLRHSPPAPALSDSSQPSRFRILLERNPNFSGPAPHLDRVRFRIVPDAIVRALELRKGSADIELSSLTPDMVPVLVKHPTSARRSSRNYFTYLVEPRRSYPERRAVRQALAYATDRETLIKYLQRGQARVAAGILPPNHWAYEPNVTQYTVDVARAEKLLDDAGFPRKANGVRFSITLKTSTDEQFRAGSSTTGTIPPHRRRSRIAPSIRDRLVRRHQRQFSIESVALGWSKQRPRIFEFVFNSKRFPPDGANRGHYRNPRVDVLTDQIRVEMDQAKRKTLCSEVQKILADDLPYLPLWFTDATSIHRKSLGQFELSPTGDFDFLAALNPTQ